MLIQGHFYTRGRSRSVLGWSKYIVITCQYIIDSAWPSPSRSCLKGNLFSFKGIFWSPVATVASLYISKCKWSLLYRKMRLVWYMYGDRVYGFCEEKWFTIKWWQNCSVNCEEENVYPWREKTAPSSVIWSTPKSAVKRPLYPAQLVVGSVLDYFLWWATTFGPDFQLRLWLVRSVLAVSQTTPPPEKWKKLRDSTLPTPPPPNKSATDLTWLVSNKEKECLEDKIPNLHMTVLACNPPPQSIKWWSLFNLLESAKVWILLGFCITSRLCSHPLQHPPLC